MPKATQGKEVNTEHALNVKTKQCNALWINQSTQTNPIREHRVYYLGLKMMYPVLPHHLGVQKNVDRAGDYVWQLLQNLLPHDKCWQQ